MTTNCDAVRRWMPCLAAMLLLGAPGCRDDKDNVEVMTLRGTVEKIELGSGDTGTIHVRYYSEKHKEEIVGVGEVTPETEILINGVVAKLSDIKEGERVRGEVRVEKRGGKQVQIALRISIDRVVPTGGD